MITGVAAPPPNIADWPAPMREAFAALAAVGPRDEAVLRPHLARGPFAFPVPAAGPSAPPRSDSWSAVRHTIDRLLAACFEVDVALLDAPVVLRTAYGEVTCGPLRVGMPSEVAGELHRLARAGRTDLLAAVAQHWREIEEAEAARGAFVARAIGALRSAEAEAAELLAQYLLRNRGAAIAARRRYLGDPRPDPVESPQTARASLAAHLDMLRRAGGSRQLGELRSEDRWVSALTLGVSAVVVVSAVMGGDVTLDGPAKQDLSRLAGLSGEAEQRRLAATSRYLADLRAGARHHPVILLLAPPRDVPSREDELAGPIDEALTDCITAIDALLREAAGTLRIPPDTRAARGLAGTVSLVSGAPVTSVWKLPFFVTRAVDMLPRQDAALATRMLEAAAAHSPSVRALLALSAIDVASAIAPVAGPAGVALAFLWGVRSLETSLREYRELQLLYRASLDPSLLLLGDGHEESSPVWVLLDLIGLVLP